MQERDTRITDETLVPISNAQRKDHYLVRAAQCVTRTAREEARLEQQRESATLVHIGDRTEDDEQRSGDWKEKK